MKELIPRNLRLVKDLYVGNRNQIKTINIPGRPSVIISMLFDRVGLGLALAGDNADVVALAAALLGGLPGPPWLILESDLTLEGEAGALSLTNFFFTALKIYYRNIENFQ